MYIRVVIVVLRRWEICVVNCVIWFIGVINFWFKFIFYVWFNFIVVDWGREIKFKVGLWFLLIVRNIEWVVWELLFVIGLDGVFIVIDGMVLINIIVDL